MIKSNHGRNRVTRQTEEWCCRLVLPARDFAKYNRLSRLNFCSGKEEPCAEIREHLFHQIELAHGNATGKQQQMGGKALVDQSSQSWFFVRSNRQLDGIAARQHHLSGERVAVAVSYLMRSGDRSQIHQFVSGRQDGYARLFINAECGFSNGGGNGDRSEIQAFARWQQ